VIEEYRRKTDEEVAEKVAEHPELIAILVQRYEVKLESYIRRISGLSFEDRQDLLQEVFISVYENINSFDPDLRFSSWVYRICHNKTINEWKKNKKKEGDISIDENTKPFVDSLYNENNIEKDIEQNISKEVLSKVLRNIKIEYREVLILKFFDGYSYDEISDIIQKPKNTVGTMVSRARQSFKAEFDKINKK
jgi:RNA polymerase sigma-70 factor (ECF subfamily)